MLENRRKDVARPRNADELLKLAACCFRHARITTNREAAVNLNEIGEGYFLKARRIDPEARRPE